MNVYLNSNNSIPDLNLNKNEIIPTLKSSSLQNLNMIEFIRWFERIAKDLIEPLKNCQTTFKIQRLLNSLFQEKTNNFPDISLLFTQIGDFKKGIVPEFVVEKTEVLSASGLPNEQGIFCTPEVATLLSTREKISLTTKEEVDALLPLIDIPFIPWSCANDGCSMRAYLAALILVHSFIDPTQIFKQYVFGKFNYQGRKWEYHVAVGIQLPDGEVRILDPSLNRATSLGLEEWIRYFKPDYETNMLVEGDNDYFPSPEEVAYIRAEIHEYQEEDHFKDRINIVPMKELHRERYLVHQTRYKLRALIQAYPSIEECFSHSLPVTQAEKKLNENARLSQRTQKKLENFSVHSSLLLTAENISAFSPNWHRAEEVERIQGLLIEYRNHLVSLPLKEKPKKKLLSAIDSALKL